MTTTTHRGEKMPLAARPTRSAGRGATAEPAERGTGRPAATITVPDGSIAALESRLGC